MEAMDSRFQAGTCCFKLYIKGIEYHWPQVVKSIDDMNVSALEEFVYMITDDMFEDKDEGNTLRYS